MAVLTGITAVRPTANTQSTPPVQYGATIAAGQTVYLDAADKKYKLADCDLSAAAAASKGIAITPGVDGSYGFVATGGSIILVGATMAVGRTYNVGKVAGSLDDVLAIGDFVSPQGMASTATQLDLSIRATGVQYA